ncbi:alpha/beta hydrolase [Kitasatospora viridis]
MLVVGLVVGASGCGPEHGGPGQGGPAAAAPLTVTAGESADRPELRAFYQQRLDWQPCDGLQCATLTVPMDYAQPANGKTFTLPVIKQTATDAGARTGSLVLDPGGPGGSGVELMKNDGAASVGASARAHFDLVGFDPRGVAGSKPAISCDPPGGAGGADQRNGSADDTPVPLHPTTPAERAAALASADRSAADCRAASGDLLTHVGTVDAARDLDVLRAALGDPKLTYLGWSYGTYLGSVYAEQFPQRVRALVLDGAIDPSLGWEEAALHEAKGFQRAVDDYAEHCADVVGRDCPADTPDGIRKLIADLYAKAARGPLRIAGSAAGLDANTLHSAIVMSMYTPESQWQPLSEALAAARHGDAGKLAALAQPAADDASHDGGDASSTAPTGDAGDPSGAPSPGAAAPDNSDAALTAVDCLDTPHPADPQAYWDALDRAYRQAGVFGASNVLADLGCRTWPAGASTPHRISPAGLPPVLVVGTTGDPATPYEDAQSLAGQLPGGMLLTYRGSGHTAYGRSNSCVTDAVDAYLVALKPVPAGTTC